MSDIVKRRGRPHSTMVGLQERYRLAERCAELTDEIVDFWTDCFRNKEYSAHFRNQISLQIMERAYGRPWIAMNIDTTAREMSQKKVIHEVR